MKMFRNLSIFVLAFLSILVVSFYGCQKEGAQVSPKVGGTVDLQVETRGSEPVFFSISPSFHEDVVASLYIKRARLENFPFYSGTYTSKLLSKLQVPTGTAIQKEQATSLWQDLLNTSTYKTPLTAPFNATKCILFRGGNDFTPKDPSGVGKTDGEYRTAVNTQGQVVVKMTHGVSLELNVNANSNIIALGAYKIISFPAGLQIIQRGIRLDHFEIVPLQEMSVVAYKSLLSKIIAIPSF
jgi:hypothetical protein